LKKPPITNNLSQSGSHENNDNQFYKQSVRLIRVHPVSPNVSPS
jgi:hypothetical protein